MNYKIGIDLGGTIASKANLNGTIKFIVKEGCRDFLDRAKKDGNKLFLISKCSPKIAKKSLEWLENEKLISYFDGIYFEENIQDKIKRILALNLDFFIDDRPQLLIEIKKKNQKINLLLLNESSKIKNHKGVYTKISSWKEINGIII
jgi:uncharacterized HAD superfamily protein